MNGEDQISFLQTCCGRCFSVQHVNFRPDSELFDKPYGMKELEEAEVVFSSPECMVLSLSFSFALLSFLF